MKDHPSISTESVSANQRAEYWHHVICETFVELECDWTSERPVRGDIYAQRGGDIQFDRVISRDHLVRRTSRAIRKGTDPEIVLLNLVQRGRTYLRQDGRDVAVNSGQYAVYDSTRPYELNLEGDFEMLVVLFPRSKLTKAIGRTEALTAKAFGRQSALEMLAARHLRNMAMALPCLNQSAATRMADTTLALISAAASASGNTSEEQSWSRTAILYRIKAYAEDHLDDPELSPAKAAAVAGISLRYLQTLFCDDGTSFSDWLWGRRLELSRQRILSSRWSSQSIGQIALASGFSNFSHFSRRFRDAYGLSARDLRALPPRA